MTLQFKENLVQKDSVTQQKEDDILDTDHNPANNKHLRFNNNFNCTAKWKIAPNENMIMCTNCNHGRTLYAQNYHSINFIY